MPGRLLRKSLFDWGPALAYMGLIWWVSSQRIQVAIESVPFRDKGIHVVEFACLGLVLARATLRTWPEIPARSAFAALVITVSWGLLDELHQAFVPGRSADANDLVADGIGAAIGVIAFAALWALMRRRGGAQA